MSQKTDALLDSLCEDLKPRRFWSPYWRSSLFFVALFAFNLIALLSEQGFRPGFLTEIAHHPRFLFGFVSGNLVVVCCFFFGFVRLTPGWQTPKWILQTGRLSFIIFVVSTAFSFVYDNTPESTFAGARHDCRTEVFLYSLIGLIGFLVFIFRSPFPTHRSGFLIMGMASALVLGALMQIACMYSPMHSLDHHYGPSFLVAAIFGAGVLLYRPR